MYFPHLVFYPWKFVFPDRLDQNSIRFSKFIRFHPCLHHTLIDVCSIAFCNTTINAWNVRIFQSFYPWIPTACFHGTSCSSKSEFEFTFLTLFLLDTKKIPLTWHAISTCLSAGLCFFSAENISLIHHTHLACSIFRSEYQLRSPSADNTSLSISIIQATFSVLFLVCFSCRGCFNS